MQEVSMRSGDTQRTVAQQRVQQAVRTLSVLQSGLVQFRVTTAAQEYAVQRFVGRTLRLKRNVRWEVKTMQ